MKQNKLVLTVLTLVISVCLACSLAACISDYECTQHEWLNTVVLTAPTCTTKGVQEQKCKWCYEKQTVEIAALDHLFSEDWSADENGHYHACTRDNCTEKADQATHLDDDKDHKCDICLETCSVCVDSDADGKCDICGNNMSVCKDDNNDHLCDDCGDKLSDCTDENKNHKCDVCGADMGEHKAAEDSHICDYCNQPASEHTGGTATCTQKAECTVCGNEYGELADHDFTEETATDGYLKTAATCTENAVYYKSCSACGKTSKDTENEATFEKADSALNHVDDNNDHLCDRENCGATVSEHTGGTATCTQKAECTICGNEYGELANHNVVLDTTQGVNGYTWASDFSTCTAHGKCEREGCTHTEDAKATLSPNKFQDATCTLPELSDIDYSFSVSWAKGGRLDLVQTKPALGHIDENKDHVCDYCNQTASDHTGGTATCQTQATCTVCSEKYGNLGEHDLEWVKSAEGHYRQCKTENCTEKEKLEEHNFKEGVCKTCDDKDIYGTEGLLYEYNAQTQTYTVIGFDLDVIDYWTWDLTVKIPYYYNDGTNGVKVVGGIGEWAFADPDDPYYYEDIDAITVPNGITFVGDHAFDNLTITYTELNDNSYLGSADNPYTVLVKGSSQTNLTVNAKIIYYRAFYDGTIYTVTIGKDVIYIGTEAFSYNYIDTVFNESSLNIVKGSTDHGSVAKDADNVYTSGKVGDFTLWLGDLEDIVTSYNGNSSSIVFPDYFTEGNTYSVGKEVFEYNTTITSVYFGTGVTSIGASAFRLAEALKTVTFADNCLLEQIGIYAFASCSSLESISFGKNSKLKIIEDNAFAGGCSALREIDIPDSVTSIQDYAFLYATGLTKVNFGENSQLSTIGISAFANATSLVRFTLPATVTFIGNYAFNCCYKLFEVINLSSLNLEKGTDSNGQIAKYAKVIKGAGDSSSVVYREDGYIFFTYSETDSVTSQTITTNYLMGYFGTQTALTLPADYNGSAYEFAPYVFASNESIKSVVVTQGNISVRAFHGCTSLQSVTFASGYSGEIIGQYAFVGTAIQHITIPASITVIKENAFNVWARKNLLKTVDFEDNSNLTTIESRAFVGCYDLVSFTLPANVNSIANDAFSGCTSLMEVINLSSLNIQAGSGDYGEIAKYATVVLSSREDATLPDENGYRFITANGINYLMFYTGTQTQLTLPESYNGEQYEIAKNAFKNNKNLTSVVIPKNVTAIGDSAFEDCSLLKTVTFEEDSALLTIGANAFKNCAIQAIVIPKNVTAIGDSAFEDCSLLKTVTFEEDSALLTIGANAFEYCAIQAIAIPKSVKAIKREAFSCCASLKTVTFEEGINLESLDQGIFYDCALISITIPKSVKNIEELAFEHCSALETVTMEEGSMLQTIGDGAFWNCYALKTINIPDSVTFIDIDVFGGCSNLTYTKYEGAYYLGNTTNPYVVLVKAANTDLNSCTIHENTKIIYHSAFENCSNLREVEIPDGVACIGQKAFYNCGINYVSCYSSVTYIGENAFATDDGEAYVDLSYYGTQEQWDAIKKGEYGNIFNRYYDVGICG